MSWMTTEGSINRVTWRDRTTARPRLDSVTRLVNGRWVTVEATAAPMSDWRRGSSQVTTEAAQ